MKNLKSFHFLLLIIPIHSNVVIAQDFNTDFLDSLPKSIQEDFLSGEDSDDLAENNYADRPDTRISKLESGIDSIKDQVRTIETELNRFEENNALKVFGSNFFSSYQSSFAPVNELNFSSDYVLDVGDILNVETFGRFNTKKKVAIARDGSVNIPKVGQIKVAGMPYAEAIKSIKEFAKSKYLDMDLYINLEQSRDMSVLLIGNASNPGIYTLPGGTNILSLLHAAGGISEKGSYRKILHKRNNKTIQEIDLYDVLINGNLLFKSPLRSGDAVVIGAPEKIVTISGGINYPAIYQLKKEENLADLINYAQGLASSALDKIKIFQASGSVNNISKESIDLTSLENGDSIVIPLFAPGKVETYTVTLKGAVKKPGVYSFEQGKTLHQLIEDAGGYLDTAYPEAGVLNRKKVAEVQQKFFEKTYSNLIRFIATPTGNISGPGIGATQNLQLILSELKNSQFSGRLAAEFNNVKVSKNPVLDTLLADKDDILIPHFTAEVSVVGDVINPGGRKYVSGSTFDQYIEQSGGLGRFADSKRIIVIKPNGDASVVKQNFLSISEVDIAPGAIIYIPREIGKLEGISLTATLAPIASSLALSLASLNSIN